MLPEVIEPYPMPDARDALQFWQSLAQETGVALLVGGYRVADPATRQARQHDVPVPARR
jgi:hypothetical protein